MAAHHAWSLRTLGLLASAHPDLQRLATACLIVSPFDLTVYSKGVWRSEEEQEQAVRDGASKLHYPDSIHNKARWVTREEVLDRGVRPQVVARMRNRETTGATLYPVDVEAIDFGPVRPDWGDRGFWLVLGGVFRCVAIQEGISVRWGGDWDGDWKFDGDQSFWDFPHHELIR